MRRLSPIAGASMPSATSAHWSSTPPTDYRPAGRVPVGATHSTSPQHVIAKHAETNTLIGRQFAHAPEVVGVRRVG